MNFILLHGFTGNPQKHFFPWLANELGKAVYTPALPNTDNPIETEQVQFALKNAQLNKDTILLGHSLGVVVALKIAEQKQLNALVLVGGFIEPKFKDKERPFANNFKWHFDFDKIKSNVNKIIILSDRNDYAIPIEQGRMLAEKLSATLIETNAQQPHFTAEQEPWILNAMNSLRSNSH